jgi:hypothetical protein
VDILKITWAHLGQNFRRLYVPVLGAERRMISLKPTNLNIMHPSKSWNCDRQIQDEKRIVCRIGNTRNSQHFLRPHKKMRALVNF